MQQITVTLAMLPKSAARMRGRAGDSTAHTRSIAHTAREAFGTGPIERLRQSTRSRETKKLGSRPFNRLGNVVSRGPMLAEEKPFFATVPGPSFLIRRSHLHDGRELVEVL